ncbi:hypothetical protein EV421DRAFT_1896019 [Armillaria borealis]|uniref:Peptide N-acetyl-beta-D-glucosaminyl asparaginase amidase A N-terminal domain-containing protein n=1 Tax=Armillaria borealis TaxID=47425 RepID=A0AA39KBJ8_9AGAR|nr:hypothetical protein EV421DRAFT_1896019 [Armillaria borealis]
MASQSLPTLIAFRRLPEYSTLSTNRTKSNKGRRPTSKFFSQEIQRRNSDEFTEYFPESTGVIGEGPFREVQVLVDDEPFGGIWPYAVIYTRGSTPYGAYDAPSYWIDITPALPIFSDGGEHNVSIGVAGQATSPSIKISGSVHVRLKTSRAIDIYEFPDLDIQTLGGTSEGNEIVWTLIVN